MPLLPVNKQWFCYVGFGLVCLYLWWIYVYVGRGHASFPLCKKFGESIGKDACPGVSLFLSYGSRVKVGWGVCSFTAATLVL